MRRRIAGTLGALLVALVASGHVGDNNVYSAGNAGPYGVQVSVLVPGVVPGLAQIAVQVDGADVRRVTVQPVYWQTSTAGAPAPDEATLVAGETRLYSARLWLMEAGPYSVRVHVSGDAGEGELFVPVNNVATRRLDMQRPLGILLVGLGGFLIVGLLTIVGAAVREGMLPPGEVPDERRRRRAWVVRAVWAVGLALALLGGRAWWSSVDAAYRQNLYRPLEVRSTVGDDSGAQALTFSIVDSAWLAGAYTPLVPDHGKLVHLFLIGDGTLDAFAHLHPVRSDSSSFHALLPPLPAGRYRMYADVVHASGFARTLTDTVELPAPTGSTAWRSADPDASWHVGAAASGGETPATDGVTIAWENRPPRIAAGATARLRFAVRDSSGAPVALEPYMGMAAHAAITREDGGVFVHLHPMGTISMVAQRQFERRSRGDTTLLPASADTLSVPMHDGHELSGTVTFPYAFPSAGRYRLWVQVKVGGVVRTGAFDVTVADRL